MDMQIFLPYAIYWFFNYLLIPHLNFCYHSTVYTEGAMTEWEVADDGNNAYPHISFRDIL